MKYLNGDEHVLCTVRNQKICILPLSQQIQQQYVNETRMQKQNFIVYFKLMKAKERKSHTYLNLGCSTSTLLYRKYTIILTHVYTYAVRHALHLLFTA